MKNLMYCEFIKFKNRKILKLLVLLELVIVLYYYIFERGVFVDIPNYIFSQCYNITLSIIYISSISIVIVCFSKEIEDKNIFISLVSKHSRSKILMSKIMIINLITITLYFLHCALFIVGVVSLGGDFYLFDFLELSKLLFINIIPLICFTLIILLVDMIFESTFFTIFFGLLFTIIPGILPDFVSKYIITYYINVGALLSYSQDIINTFNIFVCVAVYIVLPISILFYLFNKKEF